MASRNKRYAQQAADLALVRYGPEYSALAALLADAQQRQKTQLKQATGARQRTVRAVYDAGPRLTQIAQSAEQAVSPAFAQGGGIEAQALTARIGETSALAKSQLEDRRVAAIQGEGAARQQAIRDYGLDVGKIDARKTALGQEFGAYVSSTIQDLVGSDAKARADAQRQAEQLINSRGNALIGAGLLPRYDKHGNIIGTTPIPGGRLDPTAPGNQPKAPKRATPHDQLDATRQIGQGIAALKVLDPDKDPSNWGPLGDLLQRGQKPQTLLGPADPVTGTRAPKTTKNGVPIRTPEIKAIDRVYARAALQMYYRGYVDQSVIDDLHKLRLTVRNIPGLITYNQAVAQGLIKATRPRGTSPRIGPSTIPGQSRPT